MAPKTGFSATKPSGQAFKDKSKPADVRSSNINAARGNSGRLIRPTGGKPINLLSNTTNILEVFVKIPYIVCANTFVDTGWLLL